MKRRTYAGLAGLLCVALSGCAGSWTESGMDDARVSVATVSVADNGTGPGEVQLGVGDAVGAMLHDYYVARFLESRPTEEILVQESPDRFDPNP